MVGEDVHRRLPTTLTLHSSIIAFLIPSFDIMSLFAAAEAENRRQAPAACFAHAPSDRLKNLSGSSIFLAKVKLLRRLIKANRLTALLFYGPPGTGKTTLAHLLATETRCRFRQLNAVTSGVKDLRARTRQRTRCVAGRGIAHTAVHRRNSPI